uniref:Uncharacterized protein n=1 Tax=Nelumbo nucifera TaxID=4432 RepID=A0A822YA77_NELNU|nr:TPA_asm: hypothetical protein HUJ06_027956 [Nelumbo nucifera]
MKFVLVPSPQPLPAKRRCCFFPNSVQKSFSVTVGQLDIATGTFFPFKEEIFYN